MSTPQPQYSYSPLPDQPPTAKKKPWYRRTGTVVAFVGVLAFLFGVGAGGAPTDDATPTAAVDTERVEELEAELVSVREERDALEDDLASAEDDLANAEQAAGDDEGDSAQVEEQASEIARLEDELAESREMEQTAITAAEEAQGRVAELSAQAPADEPAAPADTGGLATSFGNGIFEGGIDMAVGTYVMTTEEEFCSWYTEGFEQGGTSPGQHIVDVADGTRVTTNDCGTWTLRS